MGMSDASDGDAGDRSREPAESGEDGEPAAPEDGATPADAREAASTAPEDVRALRREVEAKYDFDDFGPADMAEMSVEEWEAVFDPETWITGTALLDRVEADLKAKVETRDVFAIVERVDDDGDRVLAYSDEGYALVFPDGTVEGEGTVLRDVKPVVALCSMEDYDVPAMPEGDDLLPDPDDVPEGTGELGNVLVQAVGVVQLLAGIFLLVSPLLFDLGGRGSVLLTTVLGLIFLGIGLFLLVLVANARLSDRFRAEEYRQRLRAMDVGGDGRPDFVPVGDRDGDDGDATP